MEVPAIVIAPVSWENKFTPKVKRGMFKLAVYVFQFVKVRPSANCYFYSVIRGDKPPQYSLPLSLQTLFACRYEAYGMAIHLVRNTE